MVPAERHAVGAIRQGCARNDIYGVTYDIPNRIALGEWVLGELIREIVILS